MHSSTNIPSGFTPYKGKATVLIDSASTGTYLCDECREVVTKASLTSHQCGTHSVEIEGVPFQDLGKFRLMCKVCQNTMTKGCAPGHAKDHKEKVMEEVKEKPHAVQMSLVKPLGKGRVIISSMVLEDDRFNYLPDISLTEAHEASDDDHSPLENVGRLVKDEEGKVPESLAEASDFLGIDTPKVKLRNDSVGLTPVTVKLPPAQRQGVEFVAPQCVLECSKFSEPKLPQKRPRSETIPATIRRLEWTKAAMNRLERFVVRKRFLKLNSYFQRMRRHLRLNANILVLY
jgi:hypothetical protein